jgi:CheY-like chemotaxis protein
MPTVLVVDDAAVDRKLIGGILGKAAELQVQFASDAAEALARIEELWPDLILTDLVMPGKNGLELVKEVVDRYPRIPIVLMTGKGTEETAVHALQAGAANYVPKSAMHNYLVETVRDVLEVVRSKHSHQRLMTALRKSEFEFALENDPELIPSLISYVQSLVTTSGLCDESSVIRVCIALEESLRNAMFHGNLELTSEQREGDCDVYQRLVSERMRSPQFASRRLHVKLSITPQAGTFVVRDEGPGFDPSELPDPTDPENLEKVSGRGLLLMRTFMDDVSFNATGNQVTMVKRCSAAPSLVEAQP